MRLAETSAALTWMLGQPGGAEVGALLHSGLEFATSDLTGLEIARVLARLPLGAGEVAREPWRALQARCMLDPVDADLARELSRPFPQEPVRTLDAVHLATALRLRAPGERVGFVALGGRVRSNAGALGFVVLP